MGRMTKDEWATKEYLADKLAESGYVTYSELFELFDLRLTNRPDVVGYMEPTKGSITLNSDLKLKDMLLVIRHEILHEYLTHHMRMINHVARKMGLDPDDLDEMSLNEVTQAIYSNDRFNYAGDYEISNRGYTEEDKKTVRNLSLNGRLLGGLVTEDDHPDWVDLPLEDMYDLLMQEMEENQPEMPEGPGDGEGSDGEGSEGQSGSGEGQGGDKQPGDNSGSSGVEGGDTLIHKNGSGSSGKGKTRQSDEDGESGDGNNGSGSGGKSNKKSKKSSDKAGDQGQSGQGSQSGQSGQAGQSGQGGQPGQAGQAGQGSQSQGSGGGPSGQSGNGGGMDPEYMKELAKAFARAKAMMQDDEIFHGTFRNGKFYDHTGKELNPNGK